MESSSKLSYIIDSLPDNYYLRYDVYESLCKYESIISKMSNESLNMLTNYVLECIPEPGSYIGISMAQEIMQQVTQSSLSGKFIATNKYSTIHDILNLRSKHTKCYIYESYEVIDMLNKVIILNVIDKIIAHYNDAQIILSKSKMREHNISMKQISNTLGIKYQYGPNSYPHIYICARSDTDLVTNISYIENSVIKGTINIYKDSVGRHYCDSKYAKDLLSLNVSFECTDVNVVYSVLGIDASRHLIYKTLISNSIRPFCARFISVYMTMSGKPLAFDREMVHGKFGPMFDMYFSKPKNVLASWIINGDIDSCTNPYTKMMLGCAR